MRWAGADRQQNRFYMFEGSIHSTNYITRVTFPVIKTQKKEHSNHLYGNRRVILLALLWDHICPKFDLGWMTRIVSLHLAAVNRQAIKSSWTLSAFNARHFAAPLSRLVVLFVAPKAHNHIDTHMSIFLKIWQLDVKSWTLSTLLTLPWAFSGLRLFWLLYVCYHVLLLHFTISIFTLWPRFLDLGFLQPLDYHTSGMFWLDV